MFDDLAKQHKKFLGEIGYHICYYVMKRPMKSPQMCEKCHI